MLMKAPQSLRTWSEAFVAAPIPVRAWTAGRLAELAGREDVAVGEVAPIVLADPLMTVKLLAHVAQHQAMRGRTPVETVSQALLMLGVPPFFRAFADQPVIETVLADWPTAQQGLQKVLERAWRAADFALALAVFRKDADAEVIHEAALMHDFVEMLLWCHAPTLALALEQALAADPARRLARAQRDVLNIELCDLEQTLAEQWRLPELLVRITDDRRAEDPQARSVLLAMRIAQHSSVGWDNPELDADFQAASDLLALSPSALRERLQELDGVESEATIA